MQRLETEVTTWQPSPPSWLSLHPRMTKQTSHQGTPALGWVTRLPRLEESQEHGTLPFPPEHISRSFNDLITFLKVHVRPTESGPLVAEALPHLKLQLLLVAIAQLAPLLLNCILVFRATSPQPRKACPRPAAGPACGSLRALGGSGGRPARRALCGDPTAPG